MVFGVGLATFLVSLAISYQVMPDDSGVGRFVFTAFLTVVASVTAATFVNLQNREKAEQERRVDAEREKLARLIASNHIDAASVDDVVRSHAGGEVGERTRRAINEVGSFVDELTKMSDDDRTQAIKELIWSKEYAVKGIRWDPPFSRTSTTTVTSYQTLVDMIRTKLEPDWAEAMTTVHRSKTLAGDDDWPGAAAAIRPAIETLEALTDRTPALYRQDLAVAYFHLEAYLGNSGDRAGADAAIDRSLSILHVLQLTENDRNVEFDLARALGSKAIVHAENGDFAAAIGCQSAAVKLLQGLAETDLGAFGPALAEHMAQIAVYQQHEGRLELARASIASALRYYEHLAISRIPVDRRFVEHARRQQAAIAAQPG